MGDVININQPPPESEVVREQGIIGAAMIKESNYVASQWMFDVQPLSFKVKAHQLIWAALQETYTKTGNVDIVSVSGTLVEHEALEVVGGLVYLAALIEEGDTNYH